MGLHSEILTGNVARMIGVGVMLSESTANGKSPRPRGIHNRTDHALCRLNL
jgi:hypothetical protein